MRTLLLAGIFVASCGVALAQPQPHLVIDLNTTTASDSAGPEPMGELGGAFLFKDRYATVRGLWTTNGTAASTSLLLPLPDTFTGGALLSGGTVVDDAFLFGISPVYDVPPPPNTHAGLWRTDGTAAGTARLNTIGLYPPHDGIIFDTTSWNGAAYFGAFPTPTPEAIPSQLWRTDGTPEGATVLSDGHSPAGANPSHFTSLPNGVLFTIGEFAANPNTVWRTDGTPEGTRQVTSIPCFQLTRVGARAFMTCEDPATGRELWVTDGTEATTRLVKDLEPGPFGFYPQSLVDVDGTLFFTHFAFGSLGDAMQLWKSDGSEAGTVLVKDGFSEGLFYDPLLTPSGRSLYFIGSTTAAGHELWTSDGTTGGTVMVRDIVFGPGDGMKVGPEGSLLAAVPGGLVFTTTTPATGMELWRSSGTQASTVPYNEIEPGPTGSDPRFIRAVGSHVYLDAFQTGTGRELWAVDLAPLVNIGDASVVESDAGTVAATFPVSLTDPVASPVTVFYTTTSGTATAGVDYQPAVGTLTFDRSVGPQMVTVPVNGDLKDEPTETFTVELETIQGPVFPGRSIGLGAIVDNDSPTVTAANATVTEGNAGTTPATFTLTLTAKDGLPAPTDKRVHFATESVTASDLTDFVAQAGTVTFPPGTPSGGTASVAVSVRGDTTPSRTSPSTCGSRIWATRCWRTQVTGHIVNDDGVEHGAAVELTRGSVVRATLERSGVRRPGLVRGAAGAQRVLRSGRGRSLRRRRPAAGRAGRVRRAHGAAERLGGGHGKQRQPALAELQYRRRRRRARAHLQPHLRDGLRRRRRLPPAFLRDFHVRAPVQPDGRPVHGDRAAEPDERAGQRPIAALGAGGMAVVRAALRHRGARQLPLPPPSFFRGRHADCLAGRPLRGARGQGGRAAALDRLQLRHAVHLPPALKRGIDPGHRRCETFPEAAHVRWDPWVLPRDRVSTAVPQSSTEGRPACVRRRRSRLRRSWPV
jgi:ELWxxDGT repeat protein